MEAAWCLPPGEGFFLLGDPTINFGVWKLKASKGRNGAEAIRIRIHIPVNVHTHIHPCMRPDVMAYIYMCLHTLHVTLIVHDKTRFLDRTYTTIMCGIDIHIYIKHVQAYMGTRACITRPHST